MTDRLHAGPVSPESSADQSQPPEDILGVTATGSSGEPDTGMIDTPIFNELLARHAPDGNDLTGGPGQATPNRS